MNFVEILKKKIKQIAIKSFPVQNKAPQNMLITEIYPQ